MSALRRSTSHRSKSLGSTAERSSLAPQPPDDPALWFVLFPADDSPAGLDDGVDGDVDAVVAGVDVGGRGRALNSLTASLSRMGAPAPSVYHRAVRPIALRASSLAPALTSSSHTSGCPAAAATISGVNPCLSRASTDAPLASSSRTTPTAPDRDARCNGLDPDTAACTLGSAPYLTNQCVR
jgi:hypothetical protein